MTDLDFHEPNHLNKGQIVAKMANLSDIDVITPSLPLEIMPFHPRMDYPEQHAPRKTPKE